MTVTDLITRSLQDLNICAAGDTPDPNDVQTAFDRLNDFVDDLKNDGLIVYTLTRTTWTLTPNVASYTVGSSGTIAILRPPSAQAIPNIGFIDNSLATPYERTLGPLLTDDEYAAIGLKTLTSPFPTAFYYNPTFPTGTLYPFPIPTASSLVGVLYAETPVDEFTAVTDTVSLPPGYRRFFRNQLTIELASAFETQPPPTVVQAAMEARERIKRTNTRPSDLRLPWWTPGLHGRSVYDINSDS